MAKMLMARSAMLPRYMLAIRPHAKLGFSLIRRGPGPRNAPDAKAEDRAADEGEAGLDPVARLRPEARLPVVLDDAARPGAVRALVEGVEELAQAEKPDRDRNEVDAADELGRPHGEALLPGLQIHPDGRECEPHEGREQAVAPVPGHHDDDHPDAEKRQKEVFRRAEAPRELGEERREQRHEHDADRAADEG